MNPFAGILNMIAVAAVWLFLIVITAGIAILGLLGWGYAVFAGSEARSGQALAKLRHTLMPNEQLLAEAIQLRPFALFSRRKALGISNSRIIVVSRGLFGGFTMTDIQWKDLQDAEMNENVLPDICGSSLSFSFSRRDLGSARRATGQHVTRNGLPSMFIGGVPSEEARLVYAQAQSEEQAWEEKRRIRAIEETRAAAGGVYLSTGSDNSGASSSKDGSSISEELGKLKGLLDSGVISDAEFNEMKAKLIARV